MNVFWQTYPEEAFRFAGDPFEDRTPGRGGEHRWVGIPGLVASLDVVDARHCVAAAGVLEVVWGPLALTQDQDHQDQDQDH